MSWAIKSALNRLPSSHCLVEIPKDLSVLSAKSGASEVLLQCFPSPTPHLTQNPTLASPGIVRVTSSLQWPEHMLYLVYKCRVCFYNRVNFRVAQNTVILASAFKAHPIVACVTVCLLPAVTQACSQADGAPSPPPQGSLEVQVRRGGGLDVLTCSVVGR